MRKIFGVQRLFVNSLLKNLPKYNLVQYQRVKLGQLTQLSQCQKYNFAVQVVNVPGMGDSITEGSVLEYKKAIGQFVALDEIIAVVETDKVQVEIRSPFKGVLTKLHANQGDTIEVGKPFFDIDPEGKAAEGAAQAPPKQEEKKAETKQEAPKQQQQTPPPQQQVQQTQQQAAPQQQQAPKQDAPKKDAKQPAPPAFGTQMPNVVGQINRGEKREPMNRMRLKIAERLKASQNTYALLTTFQECDMSAVMELRTTHQDAFVKKHGIKLGFMSFFIKASVAALQTQPIVNAVIDGKDIVYRNYCDISVAVSTPNGLMVPVLRNCETQSLADLEKNLIHLADKGRQGKISLEDMAGGTFTISNGGVFGSMMGTPILNPPQSAILGMHSIINRPVVRGDQIVARPMMYLALTYDHRLVDGREAVTFLKQIQNEIEDPRRLLLGI